MQALEGSSLPPGPCFQRPLGPARPLSGYRMMEKFTNHVACSGGDSALMMSSPHPSVDLVRQPIGGVETDDLHVPVPSCSAATLTICVSFRKPSLKSQ